MTGFYFLLPTLIAVFISFLVVRAGAIALMMTGLDKHTAVFQALSALTGTGFTTREAEKVVHHPRRRRIISALMILGNAGFVAVVVTMTSSFVTTTGYRLPINLLLMLTGLFIIYKIATNKGFIRRWESFIEERLVKTAAFEESTVEDLLHLAEGYGLVRAIIKEDSPLAGSSLASHSAGMGKMLILGIEREKDWIPAPRKKDTIQAGDRLVVYGPLDRLKELFSEASHLPVHEPR